MKKFSFNFGKAAALVLGVTAFLFAGCEDAVNSAKVKIPPRTVAVTDEAELLKAVDDSTVGTVIVKNDFVCAASVNVKAEKTLVIPVGMTLTVDSLTADANLNVVESAGGVDTDKKQAVILAAQMADTSKAGVLLITKGLFVRKNITLLLKEYNHLAFAVKDIESEIDGTINVVAENAIYHKDGGGDLYLKGSGFIKVASNDAILVETGVPIPSISTGTGNDGTGADGEENQGVQRPPIEYYGTDYSSNTNFVTDGWAGAGNEGEAWTLTAVERNTVYFAVNKTVEQTITVEGADAEKVSMTESGSVADAIIDDDGNAAALGASETRTVFAVDTADLVFDGGTRSFTLKEGGREIPVTLSVTPNLTGAAVFLVTHQDGEAEGSMGTLTRIDTGSVTFSYTSPDAVNANPAPFSGASALLDALAWVDYNTATDKEWLIRVENETNELPHTVLTCGTYTGGTNEGITIRLRGYGTVERIIKYNGTNGTVNDNNFFGKGTSANNHKATGCPGLINMVSGSVAHTSEYNKLALTLQLEKGITLQGLGTTNGGSSSYYSMVYLQGRSALVMKADSRITGHYYNANTDANKAIIYVYETSTSNPRWSYQYKVVIEAGASITGNKLTSLPEPLKKRTWYPDVVSVGYNDNAVNKVVNPVVFISKGAAINNNVISGTDNVNVVGFGRATAYIPYPISTEADTILPPEADRYQAP